MQFLILFLLGISSTLPIILVVLGYCLGASSGHGSFLAIIGLGFRRSRSGTILFLVLVLCAFRGGRGSLVQSRKVIGGELKSIWILVACVLEIVLSTTVMVVVFWAFLFRSLFVILMSWRRVFLGTMRFFLLVGLRVILVGWLTIAPFLLSHGRGLLRFGDFLVVTFVFPTGAAFAIHHTSTNIVRLDRIAFPQYLVWVAMEEVLSHSLSGPSLFAVAFVCDLVVALLVILKVLARIHGRIATSILRTKVAVLWQRAVLRIVECRILEIVLFVEYFIAAVSTLVHDLVVVLVVRDMIGIGSKASKIGRLFRTVCSVVALGFRVALLGRNSAVFHQTVSLRIIRRCHDHVSRGDLLAFFVILLLCILSLLSVGGFV